MYNSLQPYRLYSPWNSPGQNTGVGRHSLLQGIVPTQGLNPSFPHCRQIFTSWAKREVPSLLKWSEVAQLCPTLCDPVDCSPPSSSIHGILQARILEWVAISFSRGSSQPRDWTQVSHIAGRRFNIWATGEVCFLNIHQISSGLIHFVLAIHIEIFSILLEIV